MNFMLSLGSLIIPILLLIIIRSALVLFINFVAVKCFKIKVARTIGTFFHPMNGLFLAYVATFLLEGCFDFSFAVVF